uniref:ATP synthase complex subunit 8 n=1 Tax=Melanophila acuminata TaxID=1483931 RepID=A0A7U0M879_9COLE|nr:ATP synthase F0 subunit 8 [Melanophila acuminata]QQX28199.1 ATP synthase F0 subunit 8 [Melanophila acuminata]
MPQMAPMNWLILFILFSIIFLIFSFLNYFNTSYPATTQTKTIKKFSYNWKW